MRALQRMKLRWLSPVSTPSTKNKNCRWWFIQFFVVVFLLRRETEDFPTLLSYRLLPVVPAATTGSSVVVVASFIVVNNNIAKTKRYTGQVKEFYNSHKVITSLLALAMLRLSPKVEFLAPSTIEECIDWIDRYCHRPFLHAVVASNYHFLYRGITAATDDTTSSTGTNNNAIILSSTTDQLTPRPTLQYEIPDLLQIETYGYDGVQFFNRIEDVLQNEIVRPSTGHLGTTSAYDAVVWGDYSASIWPLTDDVLCSMSKTELKCVSAPKTVTTPAATRNGYAWFSDGGLFYPRNVTNLSNDAIRRSIIIVGDGSYNGVDVPCRDDSLVEALQHPTTGCEIMFASNMYLAIPSMYDTRLRAKLRKSFVI